MSAATDALLRRLFADGAVPASAPPLAAGERRVAGQTLSAAVARLHWKERKLWTKGRCTVAPGKWLKPTGELPPDLHADELRKQLALLFDIPEVRLRRRRAARSARPRRRVLTSLALRGAAQSDMNKTDLVPTQPRISEGVEPFDIAPDDDRVALRGQVRSTSARARKRGVLTRAAARHVSAGCAPSRRCQAATSSACSRATCSPRASGRS